jgi:hypothetical protein
MSLVGETNKCNKCGQMYMKTHKCNGKVMSYYNIKIKRLIEPVKRIDMGLLNKEILHYDIETQYQNLNSDGTVNHQSGEVDIRVNFRSPIDINQGTGLYNFGGTSKSSPVNTFSGLYNLCIVNSKFSGGQFTQELKALRRPLQESKQAEATPAETYNNNPDQVDKKDQYNTE